MDSRLCKKREKKEREIRPYVCVHIFCAPFILQLLQSIFWETATLSIIAFVAPFNKNSMKHGFCNISGILMLYTTFYHIVYVVKYDKITLGQK